MKLPTCDRCQNDDDAMRLVPTYWGDRLCPDCCQYVAAMLDANDKWPPLADIPDTPHDLESRYLL